MVVQFHNDGPRLVLVTYAGARIGTISKHPAPGGHWHFRCARHAPEGLYNTSAAGLVALKDEVTRMAGEYL